MLLAIAILALIAILSLASALIALIFDASDRLIRGFFYAEALAVLGALTLVMVVVIRSIIG